MSKQSNSNDDNTTFKIFVPSMHDDIMIVKNPARYLKNHVVVPIKKVGDTGEPEFIAMRLKG